MKRIIIACCTVIVFALVFAVLAVGRSYTDERLQAAYRFETNGWIYVHLEGPPQQIGYQHGYILAEEIKDLLAVLKPWLEHTTKKDWGFYRDASEKILWPKIDTEFQKELDGIVAVPASLASYRPRS